jgi:hypothetical protein
MPAAVERERLAARGERFALSPVRPNLARYFTTGGFSVLSKTTWPFFTL